MSVWPVQLIDEVLDEAAHRAPLIRQLAVEPIEIWLPADAVNSRVDGECRPGAKNTLAVGNTPLTGAP